MPEIPQPIGPDEYRLGRALADVAAGYAHVDAQAIVSIAVNSEQVVIRYGVRTGPATSAIRVRVRVLDAKTSTSITDNWEN